MVTRLDLGRPGWTVRTAGASVRIDRRGTLVAVLLVGALAAGLVAETALGRFPVAPSEVLAVLLGREDGFVRTVVLEWRAPRAVAAAAFGGGLGLAGALFQSVTRNPLASPDVLGLGTGAYTGVLVVAVLVGGPGLTTLAAVAGAGVTAAVVFALGGGAGLDVPRFVVVGIGVAAMLTAFNTWFLLVADLGAAASAAAWGVGDLAGTSWSRLPVPLAVLLAAAVLALLLAPGQRQLALGGDLAASTGVPVRRVRTAQVALGVVLTAAVVAVAGPITFVALAAPQVARLLVRTPGPPLACSTLVGAVLLVGADVVAQRLLPKQVAVGIVTLVVGGGYVVWLLVTEARRTS